MVDATRNIQINQADVGYMYGSIEFAVRPSNDRYQLQFTSSDGMHIRKWEKEKQGYGPPRPVKEGEVVDILGRDKWDWSDFVAMWQG